MSLHKARMCKRSDDPVATGVLLKDVALVAALIDEGYPLTEHACRNACIVCDQAMLRLLLERGCPLDADRCIAVSRDERLKALIKEERTARKHAAQRRRV